MANLSFCAEVRSMWAAAQCLAADKGTGAGARLREDTGGAHHVMRYDDTRILSKPFLIQVFQESSLSRYVLSDRKPVSPLPSLRFATLPIMNESNPVLFVYTVRLLDHSSISHNSWKVTIRATQAAPCGVYERVQNLFSSILFNNMGLQNLEQASCPKWKVCCRFVTSPRILVKSIRARDSNSRSWQFANRCQSFFGGLWFGGMPLNQGQFLVSPRKDWLYRTCSTSAGIEWRRGQRFTCSDFLGDVWQKGGRITHRFAWASSSYAFQQSGIFGLGHWGQWC